MGLLAGHRRGLERLAKQRRPRRIGMVDDDSISINMLPANLTSQVSKRKTQCQPVLTPEPGENEFECAHCGAYFHYELTRCPNCGVNLYEPEDETDDAESPSPREAGVFSKLKDVFHKVFNKPYSADEIFGDALDQAVLYNDLLQKVGGDRATVDRSDRI